MPVVTQEIKFSDSKTKHQREQSLLMFPICNIPLYKTMLRLLTHSPACQGLDLHPSGTVLSNAIAMRRTLTGVSICASWDSVTTNKASNPVIMHILCCWMHKHMKSVRSQPVLTIRI